MPAEIKELLASQGSSPSVRGRDLCVSFPFERVVPIRVPADEPKKKPAAQVGREKKRTPEAVLPHMHMLVLARHLKA
jgi:hypothetical protein